MSDQDETLADTPFSKPSKKRAAKKAAKSKEETSKKKDVILINQDGSDSEEVFEIFKETSNSIIIKKVVPDYQDVVISGVEVKVDVNALKKMSPSAEMHGKPVSLILAAIELSK